MRHEHMIKWILNQVWEKWGKKGPLVSKDARTENWAKVKCEWWVCTDYLDSWKLVISTVLSTVQHRSIDWQVQNKGTYHWPALTLEWDTCKLCSTYWYVLNILRIRSDTNSVCMRPMSSHLIFVGSKCHLSEVNMCEHVCTILLESQWVTSVT